MTMMNDLSASEIEGLLGRPSCATTDDDVRRSFRGRRILITGAAGSIGSTLAAELARAEPAALGLLDQSELGLFNLERAIQEAAPTVPLDVSLADVTRTAAMRAAVRRLAPDVVYHVAAYKLVTMAERAPSAAALVIVVGTANAAAAARSVGARFVLISSDKAADPQSVMGATKRLAERVALSLATRRFRPIVVRFGNVLGSSGSVVEVMRDCIRAGRPVPITDPDATRYFMTGAEAVALVLRADRLAQRPETFWLDMGEPVRIGDLVRRLMDLEQARGVAPVPVQIIGLRPGEKRTESLVDPHLVFERTVDDRIRVARDIAGLTHAVRGSLERLRRAGARADDRLALETLAAAVEGFVPSGQAREAAARRRAA
jgi:FlaA1/EpsC-like NDP-sugar epimerase